MRNQLIALIVMTALLMACAKVQPNTPPPALIGADAELKQFSSAQDVKDFLRRSDEAMGTQDYYYGGGRDMLARTAMAESDSGGIAAPTASGAKAADYSQTNVQVQGVDEADIVKTDGKFLYILSGNELTIIDGYPAKDAKKVGGLTFKGYPRNLFLNDDRLVVFVDGNDEIMRVNQGDFFPRPTWTQTAQIFIYDVSTPASPKKLYNYSIEGSYFESRMVGEHAYFVVSQPVDYYGGFTLPMVRGTKMLAPDVYYFDRPDFGFTFQTVASVDVNDGGLNAQSFLLGQSATLYGSENALYLAAPKSQPWGYYRQDNLERFNKAVLPLLPPEVKQKINALENPGWDDIAPILEDMYNGMTETQKDDLIEKIEQSLEDYERNIQLELSKTTIHKIAIKDGAISYAGKGEVSGQLLNQFSMDENQGNLRVATTTSFWTRDAEVQHNSVYTLDSGMNVVGSLTDLAKGERIYSARFMGDRLYLVTFKRIDPLFVIDLSDNSNPKVLGELKVPGYSDYLHPYDADHIIGVGRDTKDTEWGGTTTAGIKLALFDVSDVTAPKQLSSYHINGSGTDSEALRDHKAFLFSKEKNLLVLPVTEVTQRGYDPRYGYRQEVWQGAYVLGLTPEDGFTMKGKVVHSDIDGRDGWSYQSAVRRSLYLEDALYTLSSAELIISQLSDLDQIKEIKLPQEQYYGEPIPVDIGGGIGGTVPTKSVPPKAVEDVE